MQFHINHTPEKAGFGICHADKLFLIGSCFSDNIGQLLQAHKFNVLANPGGILFNPVSIHTRLNDVIHNKKPDERYILERDGMFLSYEHHSSVHHTDKNELIKMIGSETEKAHRFLKDADCLIITFGSAFIYRHLQLNAIVANCHKQPAASVFEKRLLEVEEIVAQYTDLLKQLHAFNPTLKILFTVSPVKYLKDGLVENNRSKSTLLLSVHKIISEQINCAYFPAYELVNDDLRDYRFYKKDLAHPNEQAIDYIWQKFSDCFFSGATKNLNEKIQRLNQALAHQILVGASRESSKLHEFISRQKEEIKTAGPGIDL